MHTEHEEMFCIVKSHKPNMQEWVTRALERKAAGKLGAAAYARRSVYKFM